mmetsp:Transcript_8471/g.16383  ORF Transcript_8471/g.16383 Transcript_8471/m.16383 type:complete len:210 (+) Transcript_8471:988-1617(+)
MKKLSPRFGGIVVVVVVVIVIVGCFYFRVYLCFFSFCHYQRRPHGSLGLGIERQGKTELQTRFLGKPWFELQRGLELQQHQAPIYLFGSRLEGIDLAVVDDRLAVFRFGKDQDVAAAAVSSISSAASTAGAIPENCQLHSGVVLLSRHHASFVDLQREFPHSRRQKGSVERFLQQGFSQEMVLFLVCAVVVVDIIVGIIVVDIVSFLVR